MPRAVKNGRYGSHGNRPQPRMDIAGAAKWQLPELNSGLFSHSLRGVLSLPDLHCIHTHYLPITFQVTVRAQPIAIAQTFMETLLTYPRKGMF